ncbi:MAG: thioredoxin [Rikenellaceae bacterium]|nr:thioredoxin [Rikenellaceae bacterium]
MAQAITDANFKDLLAGDRPAVIDFWAEWCGPCRMIAPIIDDLAKEYEDSVVIGKCDVDQNNEVASHFGVRNIPTVVFCKNGELVDRQVGYAAKDALVEKLNKIL